MPGSPNAPHVSIVIPTYNRPEFLGRSIASALQQSLGDLEVIVVDDGSTEETAAVIGSFSDRRLSSVRHETNRGNAAAFLTGLDHAHGSFLTFLSDDDMMLPPFVESRVTALERLTGPPSHSRPTSFAPRPGSYSASATRYSIASGCSTPLAFWTPRCREAGSSGRRSIDETASIRCRSA